MIDTGRHDLDAVGIGGVELDQLLGFGRAVGEDGVGAAHDPGLGFGPPLGLGVAADGLDSGQRVERGDQRQIEPLLQQETGDPREPVVGVDDVGAELFDVVGDPVGELLDVRRQLFLRQVDRPGGHVNDLEARFDEHGLRLVVGPTTDIDPTLDAGLSERRDEFANVDVHPTAVAGARLGQWRGVKRKHGDALHVGPQPLFRFASSTGGSGWSSGSCDWFSATKLR